MIYLFGSRGDGTHSHGNAPTDRTANGEPRPEDDALLPKPGQQPSERDVTETLDLDVLFDLLKNQRRRRVLVFLWQEPDTSVGQLSRHIAAAENGKEPQAVTSTERKRVYVALYQCHLPKLDDADVITHDQDRGTVETGGNFDVVVSYLDAVADGGNGPGLADRLIAPIGRLVESATRSDSEEATHNA